MATAAFADYRYPAKANARRRCPHSTFYGLVQSSVAPGGAKSEVVVRFVTVDGRGEWCPHYTPRLLLRRGYHQTPHASIKLQK
jgi:hypothetical protein